MNDSQLFRDALKTNNLKLLQKVPKSDLHNHSTRGGNKRFLENVWKIEIKTPDKYSSLEDMQAWYEKNIKPQSQSKKGYWLLIEAAFRQAHEDGISILHMSFGLNSKDKFDYNLSEYLEIIEYLHQEHAPTTTFIPEIGFGKHQDPKAAEDHFDELLEYNFFKSIDLRGDENLPAKPFRNIFQKAEKHGLLKKSHIGEYGEVKSIHEAIESLELDQIQHGIIAHKSKSLMREISSRNIQLNICPTSNVMLGFASSYKTHPIRELYDNGINVTINSDDILIFDQSVSQEYLNLYNANLFSVEELNAIRLQGLKSSNYVQ